MKFFPTTIVDDFFDYPDDVYDLARSVEYNDKKESMYPGVLSKEAILELKPELQQWFLTKICTMFWDLRYTEIKWDARMDFMKLEPYPDKDSVLNRGPIHYDSDKVSCVGLLYLNKGDSLNAGTSFYRKKKEYQFKGLDKQEKNSTVYVNDYLDPLRKYHSGEDVPNIEELLENHLNIFEETARVQAQYNRLVLYSPELWHGPTTFGEETRYTLRFFVKYFNDENLNYPLIRHR